MTAQHYQSTKYVSSGDTKTEMDQRQDQRDEYQRQQRAQRASISAIPEDPSHQVSTKSRKRADSHQPRDERDERVQPSYLQSSYDYEQPRRFSSVDYAVPQQGAFRRLSGNFNAPTHVELEREREQRKGLKSVERLRGKVRAWVGA